MIESQNIPMPPDFKQEKYFLVNNSKSIVAGYFLKNPEKTIVAKIYNITESYSSEEATREVDLLKKLKKYKYTPRFIESKEYSAGNKKFLAIYLDYYPRGNMQGLLIRIKNNNQRLPTNIIMKMLFCFVETLKTLQIEGICHRDIKLENIFIERDDVFILADFGDGKSDTVIRNNLHTLRGTPNYLSPILASHYENFIIGNASIALVHNPYKSDVFSLGIVILNLITKNEIQYSRNHYLSNIRNKKNSLTDNILKWILNIMLQIEEANRPDFIELNKILQKVKNFKICGFCYRDIQEVQPYCLECFVGFHPTCLYDKNRCRICKNSLNCTNCGEKSAFYIKNCLENLCLDCHIETNSPALLGTLDFSVPILSEIENVRICFNCGHELRKQDTQYSCIYCDFSHCIVCLRPHQSKHNCLEFFSKSDIPCACSNISFDDTDGLFTRCNFCGMICKICLRRDIEVSHLACATNFVLEFQKFE
jgi:serine/threonine protein kinase